MDDPTSGGELDWRSAGVCGVVIRFANRVPSPVKPISCPAMIGPMPKISVRDVPDARTASRIRFCDAFS